MSLAINIDLDFMAFESFFKKANQFHGGDPRMNAIKKSWSRWALCVAVFVATWLLGLMATGWVLFRVEALQTLWLGGIGILSNIGMFSSLGGKARDDALFDSLIYLWLPLAAWLAWYVNRWLKHHLQVSFTQE